MADGKTALLSEIMCHCHFFYHKSHMDWCGIEPWHLWWNASH